MRTLKEGDKVRIVGGTAGPGRGARGIGKLAKIDRSLGNPYRVVVDGKEYGKRRQNIELVICDKHETRVYSTNRQEWICPFCDI